VSGLVEILEEYDREGFMDFVRREAHNSRISGELEMMNLDRASAVLRASTCCPDWEKKDSRRMQKIHGSKNGVLVRYQQTYSHV
jgi:hypothetical protein